MAWVLTDVLDSSSLPLSTFPFDWKRGRHKHKLKHKDVVQSYATLTQTSCEHIKSNMADEVSAIFFMIGLRRAGIEIWGKYAILRVRMSLCLCLCASENQAWREADSLFKDYVKLGVTK